MTVFILFFILILIGGISPSPAIARPITSSQTVTVTGLVLGCGDGIIQLGENCDGAQLNNQTCASLGFQSGTLSCNPGCFFNTSNCFVIPPPPPIGGGGGGGVFLPTPTGVNFSGRASPGSEVTILRDAQVVATTIADDNANFSISITGMSSGNYIFSIYSEDNQDVRSALLTFPVSITFGVMVSIGGIFIAPTIALDKSEVRRGDNIAIFGQSAPNANITITVNSEEPFFARTKTDEDGVFFYHFDTSPLTFGPHSARSKAARDGRISSFSNPAGFIVGTRNIMAVNEPRIIRGDVNNDRRVNLIDFSITAFWHRRSLSEAFRVVERERLSGDGRVDLVDFSIMAFHWTG